MRTRHSFITLLIVATLLLSSCAPRFHVDVDSISSEISTHKKSYFLLPGNNDTTAEDLQFKEFATYIHRALAAKGFVQENDLEKADIMIFLLYGIDDPQEERYSYSLPVWGQFGFTSSTPFDTWKKEYGNYETYSGITTNMSQYAITGYTSQIGKRTTYFMYLILDSYDLAIYRAEKKFNQVWRTNITSQGSSGDLRRVFPVLAAGAKEYIGVNTGNKVIIVLDEDDPVVLEIKNGKSN